MLPEDTPGQTLSLAWLCLVAFQAGALAPASIAVQEPQPATRPVALTIWLPGEAVQMWMGSPGHRSNMLNPRYQEIGVGIGTTTQGRKYWTQVFAVPWGE